MELVTLKFDCYLKRHIYYYSSNETMYSLGSFFTSDVGCTIATWDDWICNAENEDEASGNITILGKYGSDIHLCVMFDDKGERQRLSNAKNIVIISQTNLLNLLQDWKEKVCKLKPPFVTIANNNGIFSLTTSETSIELPREDIKQEQHVKTEDDIAAQECHIKFNYEHILGMELEFERRSKPQIGAFHHYNMNESEDNLLVQFSKKIMNKDNFYKTKLSFDGVTVKQIVSFFPESWSTNEVLDAIVEAYDDFIDRAERINFGDAFFIKIKGQLECGTVIEIVITRYGEIVSAYPLL